LQPDGLGKVNPDFKFWNVFWEDNDRHAKRFDNQGNRRAISNRVRELQDMHYPS
jgi:hypothetical protein